VDALVNLPDAMWRALLVLIVLAVATGCGGDGGGTQDDAETLREMLTSSAAVQRAFADLYVCLPEDRKCYTSAGPEAVSVTTREKERFEEKAVQTDNSCFREVASIYNTSLAAYLRAAKAASAGKPAVYDREISRTTQLEISFNRKLTECGFSSGRQAELSAAMRRVNIDSLRIVDELIKCTDAACVKPLARQLKNRSDEGISIIREFQGDLPPCFEQGFSVLLRSFQALRRTAIAIEDGNSAVAERQGSLSDRLRSEAQEKLATCIPTGSE
jgi:hypothetical protein